MALTLGAILRDADIGLSDAIVIRHTYVREHEESGLRGIHGDSTDAEILEYTRNQSPDPRRFPIKPAPFWVVFIREGGDRARLWSVAENRGEAGRTEYLRTFDLVQSPRMDELRDRLVVGWRSPRSWRMNATTAAAYPVVGIADAEPVPFPGFDRLILRYDQLQAVTREPRYESWRTALASVVGIYLIADTRDGRHYVGKADGAESIRQRWSSYATSGHGGNTGLRGLDPTNFRFSLLRVFDPSAPTQAIDMAESHFKVALDTRTHGLNRN